MLKRIGMFAAVLSAVVSLAAQDQVWPKDGLVRLQSGDYRITVLGGRKGRISGFAYQGMELFCSSSASAGTRYEPFPKETPVSLKVTVDGNVPPSVGRTVSGNEIVLEREVYYGDLRLSSRYTVTPKGLLWSLRYKLENVHARPKYFYLFTMAWSTAFTEYIYSKNGAVKSGVLNSDGKWKIRDDLQSLVLYDPARQVAAVSEVITPIPTEFHRHTVWDIKGYHKYFLLHQRPKWENGYESPEYAMFFAAYKADAAEWKKQAEALFAAPVWKSSGPVSAPAPASAPAAPDKKKYAASLDFESDAPNHVTDDPFEGKKCFQLAGGGKASPAFPLKLQAGTYRFSLQLKKGICTPDEAKKISFEFSANVSGKSVSLYRGGSNVFGEEKWNECSGTFTVPAGGSDVALVLHNASSTNLYVDAVRIEKTAAPAKSGGKTISADGKVNRPVPPITEAEAAEQEKDWLVNRRGIEALDDDFILPPFSPVRLDGRTASVWGRDYTFGPFNLLESVRILNEDFLAGPMEFSAVVNGKKVKFRTGEPVVVRRRKGIVEMFTRANSPDVDVEVRTAVEYDGMIKVDFTFDPRGSVRIDEFRYTIPYPEKYDKFIHYTGARERGLSLNVPRISNTRRLPAGKGVVWDAAFKIQVWLGSYDRGLLWFCESERNWSPHDRAKRKQGLAVRRENGLVKLEVTPISEPKLIGKPTTYTFGLMATPVRPRTPGWRATDMNYEYHAKTSKQKYGIDTPVIYSSGSYDFVPPATRNPAAVGFYPRLYNIAAYRQRVETAHRNKSLFGIYIDPILCNIGIYKDMSQYKAVGWDPTTDNADAAGTKIDAPFLWQPYEVKKYFGEWHKEPIGTAPYGKQTGQRQFQVGLGSRYADFFCYLIEKHADNGCDGVANLDEWGPVPDQNARHDMGYFDADGKRYPEYDWFARRKLLKRMCAIFYKKHGRIPVMRVHLAATLVAPIASFCDSVVTGENINSAYFIAKSLVDKYTVNGKEIVESLQKNGGRDFLYYVSSPDRWAIEYGGQAFGWNVCVMSNLTKSPKLDPKYASSATATRDYLAMCLIHDNTLWPVFCKPDPAYRLIRIKQDFRIGDPGVEFFPYWGGKQPVTVDGKECYTAVWRNGDQYLAAVANLSLKDQSLAVSLDKKLSGCKVTDAETGKQVEVSGGSFRVDIPRRNYRIYRIGK